MYVTMPAMKRTTIWLDEKDDAAIEAIKKHYGLGTKSDAIRMALRELERKVKQESDND